MNGKRVIGVDVGKRWLDVAWESFGNGSGAGSGEGAAKAERYANEATAVAALAARLDPSVDVVVLEATGGYERGLEKALAAAGVPWSVVASNRVRAFRQAQGVKAKTDRIDARLLQLFGRDRLNAPGAAFGALRLARLEDGTLRALLTRRRQIQAALHAERCQMEMATLECVSASHRRTIAHLQGEAAALEAELAAHERADPVFAAKAAVLRSRIGVGPVTARALLAELPELGRLDRKAIASLGGLAPRVHQSGAGEKRRGLVPGRAAVKAILFNPARTAIRHDPEIAAFCRRLRLKGKPGKVVLAAVMRKLLVRLNATLRDWLAQNSPPAAAAPA